MLGSSACSAGAKGEAAADEPTLSVAQVLRVAMTAPLNVDPARLNPTRSLDALAADLMYDGLTAYDRKAESAVPELAASWATEDGVTWRFTLDPRRTWSDGAPITASDVVASLRRVQALSAESIGASRLDIVTSVVADGGTVVITLKEPNRELPALLADPTYGIVPPDTSPAITTTARVSGHFRPTAATAAGVTLSAEGGRGVQVIEFVTFDNAEAARSALVTGDVELAALAHGAVAPDGASVVDVSAATLVLEFGVNGVLAPVEARRAIAHHVDRAAIAAAIGSARADDLVPGDAFGSGACDPACSPEAAFDLATLGSVHLDVGPGGAGEAAAADFVRQLGAAGLPFTVRPSDSAAFQAVLAEGRLELAMFAVVGLSPTPDPYLSAVLSSVGSENLSGFASAEVDAALARARTEPDDAARQEAYRSVETTALASVPVLPLATVGERFAVSDRVSGVAPFAGVLFDADELSVDG